MRLFSTNAKPSTERAQTSIRFVAGNRRVSRGVSRQRGATMMELMTTLAVAAVLASAAAPGMANLVGGSQADAAIARLHGAVQFARQLAVARRVTATLCPGSGSACGRRNSWHEGALIFLDENANGAREAGEEIVSRLAPLAAGYRVAWRSFRNRRSLSMRPTGLTDWQNGSMLLCPPDGDARQARLLIVSAHGRARLGRDSDGDGVVERANGRPVSC